jgi:secreted Zn-dependent insulinase-like peptidase
MSWSGYSDKLPQFAIEILKKIEAMKVDDEQKPLLFKQAKESNIQTLKNYYYMNPFRIALSNTKSFFTMNSHSPKTISAELADYTYE